MANRLITRPACTASVVGLVVNIGVGAVSGCSLAASSGACRWVGSRRRRGRGGIVGHSADGWQARIIKDPIRRPWNGGTRTFSRGDLETAWLVIAEYMPDHNGTGFDDQRMPVRGSVLLDRLEEFGFPRGTGLLYLVAAAHWDGN